MPRRHCYLGLNSKIKGIVVKENPILQWEEKSKVQGIKEITWCMYLVSDVSLRINKKIINTYVYRQYFHF